MLTALNTQEGYECLIEFGELLVRNQFALTNVYGDSGLSYAHKYGNYRFLEYFLGLANDAKYKHQCERYISKLRQQKMQPKCDAKSAVKCN